MRCYMDTHDVLVKGTLLHDIGKICIRANEGKESHSLLGARFLEPFFKDTTKANQLLHCIKYHHGRELGSTKLKDDDLAYITYEADNLSAGIDRRMIEDGTIGFDKYAALHSIFDVFGTKNKTNHAYYLRGLDESESFNYPQSTEIIASVDKYKKILDVWKRNFQKAPIDTMEVNELLRIMEDTCTFIPSSTNTQEACDISLYMHSKIAAAIATSMKAYFDAHHITNYKQECVTNHQEFRKKEVFLLLSGDMSGIQNFIYTIPSKQALKTLRGRSFYLEIVMQSFIDELLTALGLTRVNLMYAGGGHFYIVAPNTRETIETIDRVSADCNQWLLQHVSNALYIAVGYTACTGEDMLDTSGQRSMFSDVSRQINQDKMNRYDRTTLGQLFDMGSDYNRVLDDSQECSVCHTSSSELMRTDEDTDICPMCRALTQLGEKILSSCNLFIITDDDSDGVPIFAYQKTKYLQATTLDTAERLYKGNNITRIYSKNESVTGELISTRIWLADYAARNDNHAVLTFEELANISGSETTGIKRLGVLRADVDNLGAAFISGFVNDGPHANHYGTFSRYAELSRSLEIFFKSGVTKICRGELVKDQVKPFHLFNHQKLETQRNVHIVYSGGDDVFIVGAWDELIELAVDIRRCFTIFTTGKLTFSAGLALFTDSYPISKMAEITGMLESEAKKCPNKDSIALFGFTTNQQNGEDKSICQDTYSWQEFIDGVCGSKLNTLLSLITFDEHDTTKLYMGKTVLYRLKSIVDDIEAERLQQDRSNIARFIYMLARMQPNRENIQQMETYKKLSECMYQWIQSDGDRKELLTALRLMVYFFRDKGVD